MSRPTDSELGSDGRRIKTPLTREALYTLVWSEPMLKVASRFGVSSSYMARVCRRLNVPRPQRGYWAKLEVGKAPARPPLPEAQPGDELVWSKDSAPVHVARPLPRAPPPITKKRTAPKTVLPSVHPLIRGAKELFEAGRLSYDVGYLKPTKRLLVDLAVTKTGLDKALAFGNQLFLYLEGRGHRVVIAPHGELTHREEVDECEKPRRNHRYSNLWSPGRCTVVYVGTVAIGLTVIEMSEEVEVRYVGGKYVREDEYIPPKNAKYRIDHTWKTTKDFATGRLCLQAYSPYQRTKWVRQWRETKLQGLLGQLSSIVKELEHGAVEIADLVKEAQRQAELEHQRWEAQKAKWQREEAERRATKALNESKEELLLIINDWAESARIEQFFNDIQKNIEKLDPSTREILMERLRRARELIEPKNSVERLKKWRSPEERSGD